MSTNWKRFMFLNIKKYKNHEFRGASPADVLCEICAGPFFLSPRQIVIRTVALNAFVLSAAVEVAEIDGSPSPITKSSRRSGHHLIPSRWLVHVNNLRNKRHYVS